MKRIFLNLRWVRSFAMLVFMGALISGVWAHGGATGIVKQRMDLMAMLGSSMKQLSKIMRNKIPYNADEVRDIAKKIEAHAGEKMTKFFPEGSLKKPSESRPEIWKDWAAFEELAKRLVTQARALDASAKEGKPPVAAIRDIGKTCTACHKRFRLKKKK